MTQEPAQWVIANIRQSMPEGLVCHSVLFGLERQGQLRPSTDNVQQHKLTKRQNQDPQLVAAAYVLRITELPFQTLGVLVVMVCSSVAFPVDIPELKQCKLYCSMHEYICQLPNA